MPSFDKTRHTHVRGFQEPFELQGISSSSLNDFTIVAATWLKSCIGNKGLSDEKSSRNNIFTEFEARFGPDRPQMVGRWSARMESYCFVGSSFNDARN